MEPKMISKKDYEENKTEILEQLCGEYIEYYYIEYLGDMMVDNSDMVWASHCNSTGSLYGTGITAGQYIVHINTSY